MSSQFSRRVFLIGAAGTMAGCATAKKSTFAILHSKSPNEKLNVAGIGVGGQGGGDIGSCKSENVVALCDADWTRAAKTFDSFPNAKKYKDYREMLDKEHNNIDACTVSTPDHVHAFAAMAAMQLGKHVYVQKPMTHLISEARILRQAAAKYKVASQMGNQGHSGEGVRRLCEIIWGGVIGDVHTVHCWTNRPIWPQGIPNPLPEEPIGDRDVDWNLWIGPSPFRSYNKAYSPFNWRGWFDFGTGALGDMACHLLDPANWSLKLEAPTSVECVSIDGKNNQTYPNKSIIKYEFPKRGKMAPVTLYWYDGGLMPPRPKEIPDNVRMGDGDNGSLFIGTKGMLHVKTYGDDPKIVPVALEEEAKAIPKTLPRTPEHHKNWIEGCKGGPLPDSNFDYAAPFTEWVLLGTIAVRYEGKLLWDSRGMKFTNNPDANKHVKGVYRPGWSLDLEPKKKVQA